jgi:NAD(P)H-nitrite reductase large subunit
LVNDQAADVIQKCIAASGVQVYTGRTVQEIISQGGRPREVLLDDGTLLRADLVVVAAGIQPNIELAQSLGAELHQLQGIMVDNTMRTSIPGIFAAGDVVVVRDHITGQLVPSRTWPDAMLQGITAAHGMAGLEKTYPGVATIISSSFFGIKFARLGLIQVSDTNQGTVVERRGEGFYHLFVIKEGLLKGFLLVGDTSCAGALRMAILTQKMVSIESIASLMSYPDIR